MSWCRRQTIGGDGAVAAARPGPNGRQLGLSRAQELDLIELLRDHHPDRSGLTGRLWTRDNLTELIHRQYQFRLESPEVNDYMRTWGAGPREPRERACGLCVDAVTTWLADHHPRILQLAAAERAEVHWLGRTRLHGVVPAADVISANPVRGPVRFVIGTPTAGPAPARDFLLRLSGPAEQPIHVVMDGSWARGDWPRRLPPHITLHPLPACGRQL